MSPLSSRRSEFAVALLRRRVGKALAICLAAWLWPLTVGAEPPGKGPRRGPPPPPPIDRILEENAERLDLAPETQAEIVSISQSSRAEGDRIREELKEAHAALREALAADPPDDAKVMALADEIGALETAAHKSRLQGMLAIRSLLTPEQRQILVEIHEERRRRRRQEGRRGPPGGSSGHPGPPPGPPPL